MGRSLVTGQQQYFASTFYSFFCISYDICLWQIIMSYRLLRSTCMAFKSIESVFRATRIICGICICKLDFQLHAEMHLKCWIALETTQNQRARHWDATVGCTSPVIPIHCHHTCLRRKKYLEFCYVFVSFFPPLLGELWVSSVFPLAKPWWRTAQVPRPQPWPQPQLRASPPQWEPRAQPQPPQQSQSSQQPQQPTTQQQRGARTPSGSWGATSFLADLKVRQFK